MRYVVRRGCVAVQGEVLHLIEESIAWPGSLLDGKSGRSGARFGKDPGVGLRSRIWLPMRRATHADCWEDLSGKLRGLGIQAEVLF